MISARKAILILMVYVLIFSSCKKFPNYRGTLIEYETSLSIEVKKAPINRGVLMLNNKYFIETNTPLVLLDTFPDFIKDNEDLKIKINNWKIVDNFHLSEIQPNYYLIKEKMSNTFFVIKDEDTLIFKLIDRNLKDSTDPTINDYLKRLIKN